MTGTRAGRGRGHLGDRTAAFVDGRLTGLEAMAALRHLDGCETCAAAVRAQRLLKWRMSGLSAAPVTPPASLLGRLADLGDRLGESGAGRVPDWTAPAAALSAPARRRRAVPRALLAGGLSVLAVSGAYAVAPGASPARPPASVVPASVPSVPPVPSVSDAGVVRARPSASGSEVLRAAVAVEPVWSTSRTGATATILPTGLPTEVR